MLSVQEALDFLLQSARSVSDIEQISTLDATGRVLAADQHSQLDVPPMDNTQMDGYAACLGAGPCGSNEASPPYGLMGAFL